MNHLSVRADKTSSKHNQTGKKNYQKAEKFNPPPPPQINMPPLHKYIVWFQVSDGNRKSYIWSSIIKLTNVLHVRKQQVVMFVIVNSVVPYITIIYPFQDLENRKN